MIKNLLSIIIGQLFIAIAFVYVPLCCNYVSSDTMLYKTSGIMSAMLITVGSIMATFGYTNANIDDIKTNVAKKI